MLLLFSIESVEIRSMAPQNTPLWHIKYLELKVCEEQQMLEARWPFIFSWNQEIELHRKLPFLPQAEGRHSSNYRQDIGAERNLQKRICETSPCLASYVSSLTSFLQTPCLVRFSQFTTLCPAQSAQPCQLLWVFIFQVRVKITKNMYAFRLLRWSLLTVVSG